MRWRNPGIHVLRALAVVGVLTASSRATAQYYRPASQFPFVSSIDAPMTYGAYTEGPGFFMSRIAPPDAPEEQVAYVHIRVTPPRAEISFEGKKTLQIGTSRVFVSPPLTPGEDYLYTIGATWNDNGKSVSQVRKINVRAGDRVSVLFRAQPASKSISLPRAESGSTQ